jgi:hypothetical protein
MSLAASSPLHVGLPSSHHLGVEPVVLGPQRRILGFQLGDPSTQHDTAAACWLAPCPSTVAVSTPRTCNRDLDVTNLLDTPQFAFLTAQLIGVA